MGQETNTTTGLPEAPSGQPVPPKDGPIGVEAAAEKRKGPGRPKKEDPKPLTAEPPPAKRKTPEQMKDIRAALLRNHEDRKTLIARYREEHPESEIADDQNPFETKRAMGAPIPANAFEAPLRVVVHVIGSVGGLEKDELPTDEQFHHCAEEWGRASIHLGVKESAAALISAGSSSLLLIGGTIVRAVTKKPKEKPHEDRKPAPVVPLNKGQEKIGENAK